MNKVLYIVGPTASGKTGLAIRIAKQYNGEIICADSRTIYKGLDIGTAKPSTLERDGIVHYGLDLINPPEKFSAADFVKLAKKWIEDIKLKGKLPIIVGGTGLYIDALYFNFSFSNKADESLREELEKLSITELQNLIVKKSIKMPENSKNKRYLMRSIERGGVNGDKDLPDKNSIIIGINPPMEVLKKRIHERTISMFRAGVIREGKGLFDKYGLDCPGASANIYRALQPYFQEQSNIEDVQVLNDSLDKKLAKRQITWFKRNKYIKWFTSDTDAEEYLRDTL